MMDAFDFEGEYRTADGVAVEARYQQETDLFILSRLSRPTDLRAIAGPAFVEAVEREKIVPLEADR